MDPSSHTPTIWYGSFFTIPHAFCYGSFLITPTPPHPTQTHTHNASNAYNIYLDNSLKNTTSISCTYSHCEWINTKPKSSTTIFHRNMFKICDPYLLTPFTVMAFFCKSTQRFVFGHCNRQCAIFVLLYLFTKSCLISSFLCNSWCQTFFC